MSCISSRARILHGLVGHGLELPVLILLVRPHELVGDADRVVRVLVLDRVAVPAVQVLRTQRLGAPAPCAPRAPCTRRSHERRSAFRIAILAARRVLPPDLIVPADASAPAHERDRPARRAAAVHPLLRGAERRQVDARARPPLKIVPSSTYQLRIEDMWSSTARMKQADACADMPGTPVEPHRRVERRLLRHQQVRELLGEDLRVLIGGEVAAGPPPPGDRVDHAPDELADRWTRAQVPSVPRKYFWATMFVAFWDQVVGNSTSRCSNALPPSL